MQTVLAHPDPDRPRPAGAERLSRRPIVQEATRYIRTEGGTEVRRHAAAAVLDSWRRRPELTEAEVDDVLRGFRA